MFSLLCALSKFNNNYSTKVRCQERPVNVKFPLFVVKILTRAKIGKVLSCYAFIKFAEMGGIPEAQCVCYLLGRERCIYSQSLCLQNNPPLNHLFGINAC